jgi:hypothetical protein
VLAQRIKRQNVLIVTVVLVTIAAVAAAVIYLIWHLANSVDLS